MTVLSSKRNDRSWVRHETRIQCRVEGFPRLTIHWSVKDMVTNAIFSEAISQSTLTVTPTSQSDFAIYPCYALNSLGYDTRSFVLVQLGKVFHLLMIRLFISLRDVFPVTRNVRISKQ